MGHSNIFIKMFTGSTGEQGPTEAVVKALHPQNRGRPYGLVAALRLQLKALPSLPVLST